MKRVCALSLILLAVSSLVGVTEAQYLAPRIVNIPDANLAAAIRDTLELYEDRPIIAREMRRLTTLVADGRGISSLIGLEHATALTTLTAPGNQIRDLEPLKKLTNLTALHLSANEISDVTPLQELTNLTTLYISKNNITDVSPLAALTNLTRLSLMNNQIRNMSPLVELINLQRLELKGNPLKNAEWLYVLPEMTSFDIEIPAVVDIPDANLAAAIRNALSLHPDVPITKEKLERLKSLDAPDSDISDLTGLEHATGLIILVLNNNQIRDLSPLAGLTHLYGYLELSDNNISDLSPLIRLRNLGDLRVAHNNVSDISPLTKLRRLNILDLADNQIRDITPLTKSEQFLALDLRRNKIHKVEPLAKLKLFSVKLDGNPITDAEWLLVPPTPRHIDIDLPALMSVPDANLKAVLREVLDISQGSPIAINKVQSITTLDASNREIKDLTGLERATGLTSLTLSNNQIRDMSLLQDLTNLTQLNLTDNGITEVNFLQGLANLTQLHLNNNDIRDLTPLEGLTRLTQLNLMDNGITDIEPLKELKRLTQLGLERNDITDIEPLRGLTRLTVLKLSYNNISELAPLSAMRKLMFLQLDHNQISSVEPLGELENLQFLRLAENPIEETYPLAKLPNFVDVDIEIDPYPPWDVNEDGAVNQADLLIVLTAIDHGTNDPAADVNHDGTVNNDDMRIVIEHLDASSRTSAPTKLVDPATLAALDAEQLRTQIQILRVENDGSLKYKQAIAFLEQLLGTSRPDTTELLANYPNPFNPETWIPYHLANDSDVQIVIYDAHGIIIRNLELEHQSEGYYTNRSRAAYWDGRNAYGERVASGIYFYQLQADKISPMRKMVILK